MRTDRLAFVGLFILAWYIYIAFGLTSSWPQQIPLESHFDGQDQSGADSMLRIDTAGATITNATITNATVTTTMKLQEWMIELAGEPANEVLATTNVAGVSKVIPISVYDLIRFPSFPPILKSIGIEGAVFDATDTASQLRLSPGNGIIVGITDEVITVGSTITPGGEPGISAIGLDGDIFEATDTASQVRFIAGTGMTIARATNDFTFTSSAAGTGDRGAPTIIVGASDSINAASADFQCDGSNDDVEIQLAIDCLGRRGGVCYLMEGTYLIGAQIRMATKYILLQGAGDGTILNRGFNYNSVILVSAHNTMVRDMTINGQRATYTNSNNTGISLSHASEVRIENIYAYNSANAGICVDPDSTDNLTHNCILIGNGAYGIQIQGGPGNQVSECYSADNGYAGFGIGGSGNMIENCRSHNNQTYGIYVNSARYSLAIGNESYDDIGTGICYDGNSGGWGVVSNNEVYSAGSNGFSITNAPSGTVVSGNSAYNCGGDGFSCTLLKEGVVSGNFSYLSGSNGFNLYGCDYTVVTGNSAYDNTRIGIFVNTGDGVLVDGNYCYTNGTYGVEVYGSNRADVINNKIYDNGENTNNAAIYLDTGSAVSNSTIRNNIIYDSQGTSSAIYCTNIGVKNVCIEGNKITGVFADNGLNINWSRMQLFNQAAYSSVLPAAAFILSGSTEVCVNIGSIYPATGGNILSVSFACVSNPIATSWDMWSNPEMKKNIKVIPVEDRVKYSDEFSSLKDAEIEFDWKLNQVEPKLEDFADVKDATGDIVQIKADAFAKAQADHQRSLAVWQANPNKMKQRGFDITNPAFPERLKSYDTAGKANGINTSQLLFEMYNALQVQRERIEVLEKKLGEIKP